MMRADLGVEGAGDDVDDAGGAVVVHVDHAMPGAQQLLDGRVRAEGEERVVLGGVVDRAQVEIGVDILDDALAADVFVEDVGIRGGARADLGERAEQPRRGRGGLLGADREGDLGMILVGGAGVEIAGDQYEGQQHEKREAREKAPVPGLDPGRRDLAGDGRRGLRLQGGFLAPAAPVLPTGGPSGARLARLRRCIRRGVRRRLGIRAVGRGPIPSRSGLPGPFGRGPFDGAQAARIARPRRGILGGLG